jgi:hypothetical protein
MWAKPILQAPLAKLPGRQANVPLLLTQLSWYHHITLLDKVKEPAARLFYIEQTVKNG